MQRCDEERAAEELGPGGGLEARRGEHTDARDAEAEHMVGDRRQVSSPGGRRGGQVGDRQTRDQAGHERWKVLHGCNRTIWQR